MQLVIQLKYGTPQGTKFCNRPIHFQSYWENKYKGLVLIYSYLLSHYSQPFSYGRLFSLFSTDNNPSIFSSTLRFFSLMASHNYCTLHHVTEQTARLVLVSRSHEGAAAKVRGSEMSISADREMRQMTDKPELMRNSGVCCKLSTPRAADSDSRPTCISRTPCLHELYAYQHKLEAISSANDNRDM